MFPLQESSGIISVNFVGKCNKLCKYMKVKLINIHLQFV